MSNLKPDKKPPPIDNHRNFGCRLMDELRKLRDETNKTIRHLTKWDAHKEKK